MKRFALCLLLSICLVSICISSDCKIQTKLELYNRADIVLIGKVNSVTDSTYTVQVVESFKGNIGEEIVGLITNDVQVPKRGWTLLIYGTLAENKYFIADVCSGTKSFEIPFGSHDYNSVDIPPKEVYLNPVGSYLSEQIAKNRSLGEMRSEIEKLRLGTLYKNELNQSKELFDKISTLRGEITWLWWGISLIIVFNIILIIILLRKL